MRLVLFIAAAAALAGCTRLPMKMEFYEPRTTCEREQGYGALKSIDYTKPSSGFTVFGFSVF